MKDLWSNGNILLGRKLIVLTRNRDTLKKPDKIDVANSIKVDFEIATDQYGESEAFTAGDGEIYASALMSGVVDQMYVTLVHEQVEADTFLPDYDEMGWSETMKEGFSADHEQPYP